jgi:hypothetical protein
MNRLINIGAGAGAAVAARLASQYNATWGPLAAMIGIGYLMNNETLLTLSGMQLSAFVPLPGGSSQASNGLGWY